MKKQVVVLLHGVGSNGNDMAQLGKFWQPQLPNVVFLAPNAPEMSDVGSGYQWFSIAGVTEASRPSRIFEARASFDALITKLFSDNDINPQRDQVVFVGFSQGSIMSLDLLVSGRLALAGIVAYSGRLASPTPYQHASDTSVLLIHGKADPVISWHESEAALAQLQRLGYQATAQYEAHTVHTISNEGANAGLAFIKQIFD